MLFEEGVIVISHLEDSGKHYKLNTQYLRLASGLINKFDEVLSKGGFTDDYEKQNKENMESAVNFDDYS